MASRGRTSPCAGVCVCQHLCVMARCGAFSSISHMPSLPKACGIVEEKNWIKVILSLCSSSPQSLSSCFYTHSHTHTAPHLFIFPSRQFISERLCSVFDHRVRGLGMPWTLQKVSTLGSRILSVSVFLLARLKTSKWDASASSKYSFIYRSNFVQTNVLTVKQGRLTQIDPLALKWACRAR